MSFIAERVQIVSLTFDDVLMIPAYSVVLPHNGNRTTHLANRIELKIPVASLQLFPTKIHVPVLQYQRSS